MSGARQRGAALIEVLVALAIVALGLGTLFAVVGDGSLRAREQGDRQAALVVAQSQIEAAGRAYPLGGAPVTGRAGPLVYRIESRPYGAKGQSLAGDLWFVTVSVRRDGVTTPLVVLGSIRLDP
ncbi:type II secretion system GspH family protein [Zavarzinia compransoris]|uniref:type IV pilus modification PilV family protein n=1 Tax=Zavarzinia marina TaxID=2911065 RepID=UPI001F254A6E|nr:type II secretion system protein [Zavarzinia marina]MCF4164787.1 type II secretion system GspH family protein [Zavarzinia marina]